MAAETQKELQQQKKRFLDLAERSWRQNLFTFTGFLSLAEQDVLAGMRTELPCKMTLYGGTEHTERLMCRFGDPQELGYEEPFPITCLRVEPLMEKFSDTFTHRDFLGAIMNLGIDRSTVGDIFLEGKKAYVFCSDTMAPYLMENLDQVRHTHVKCSIVEDVKEMPVRQFRYQETNVASLRCDGVVSAVWNLSRSQSLELFRQKKIYVGGRLLENNSYLLKPEDVVSARGYGKFIFRGEKHTTRKGKLVVGVDLFV
ncbi:MAG: hypothetical protein IJ390_05665 [Lachnospiraceae bacterium]|nr:hypothetical protein [Lachnospiraceae bacterium]